MAKSIELGLNIEEAEHLSWQSVSPQSYIRRLIHADMERTPAPEGSIGAILKPLGHLNKEVAKLSAAAESGDAFQAAEDCICLVYEIEHALKAFQQRAHAKQ